MPDVFRFSVVLFFLVTVQATQAKVVVLANRTLKSITIELDRQNGRTETMTIASGESLPAYFQRQLSVVFGEGLQRQRYFLQPSSAYFFSYLPDGKRLHLEQIGLGEQPNPEPTADLERSLGPPPETVTINVKVLADENEPTHRRIWEPKLRKRIAEASKILEKQSGIRLNIVEVTTWDSDENQKHFVHTLREFEREVKPQPAEVVIGFSSQYEASRGRSHLGVTRWPMHTHILIRERSRNLLEAERLELLVHELGHYLGASHSPEPQSVMRPQLTRGLQRTVGSRITFDPVNALIIAIMGEEIRTHGTRDIRRISQPTRNRLNEIYGVLVQAMPEDPAARQYVQILKLNPVPAAAVAVRRPRTTPITRDTKKILEELVALAENRSSQQDNVDGEADSISGDELTNLYVRHAARAAKQLRSTNAKRAMLLALGIFVDDTVALRQLPGTGKFVKEVEPDAARTKRLQVLGSPTMRERADLTKHFFVSAHLHVAIGKPATVSAGLAKEMRDSQGGTGFSFVDMAANRAGIVFAEQLLADKLSLERLAEEFYVDDYLPTLRGLEEGLTAEQLKEQYEVDGQTTIPAQLEEIEQRVLSLPVYDQL